MLRKTTRQLHGPGSLGAEREGNQLSMWHCSLHGCNMDLAWIRSRAM